MVLFFLTDAIRVLPGGELIPLSIGLIAFSWISRSLTHPHTARLALYHQAQQQTTAMS